jgi:hypothetical protein
MVRLCGEKSSGPRFSDSEAVEVLGSLAASEIRNDLSFGDQNHCALDPYSIQDTAKKKSQCVYRYAGKQVVARSHASEIEVCHQKQPIGCLLPGCSKTKHSTWLLKDYAQVARRKRGSAAIFLNDLAVKMLLLGRDSQNQDWSLEALKTNC